MDKNKSELSIHKIELGESEFSSFSGFDFQGSDDSGIIPQGLYREKII